MTSAHVPPFHGVFPVAPATRAALLELAREVDPVALRWGR